MLFPNIFLWNCREAGSNCFLRHVLQYIHTFNPNILILVETRVSSSYINCILHKSNYTNFLAVEACGFSGGIWMIWDATLVHVETVTVDDQIFNLVVKRGRASTWFLSAIYASPKPNFCNDLWQYVGRLGAGLHFQWLLLGDFNQLLDRSEKRGGRPLAQCQVRQLREMIDRCELIDMGYEGSKYTWSNMRSGLALVEEHIDRCFSNRAWMSWFSNFQVYT